MVHGPGRTVQAVPRRTPHAHPTQKEKEPRARLAGELLLFLCYRPWRIYISNPATPGPALYNPAPNSASLHNTSTHRFSVQLLYPTPCALCICRRGQERNVLHPGNVHTFIQHQGKEKTSFLLSMESSSSSSLLLSSSSGNNNKRPREADLATGGDGPDAEGKRMRPEDLLDMLDDETADAEAGGDLASVMRSLEEEISAGELDLEVGPPQPELGFLLEASDDELGLPPAGGSYTSSDDYAGDAFGAQIWGFEDEIDGAADYGFGAVTSSPEAAAAAAAAAAEWGDDGFDAGLFGFGDDSFGPSDLESLRQETTMPAV